MKGIEINPEASIQIIQNGYWSAGAIAFSASIAAIIAIRSIANQNRVARMRATLDVILKSESDTYYQDIYSTFTSELTRSGGLISLIDAHSDNEKRSRRNVHDFLNHYELIAIAIEKNILDEDFYKEWMRSTYIKHYQEAEEYIDLLNKGKNTSVLFINFKELANKWDRE